MNIIESKDGCVVSARELHSLIKIKKDFSTWAKFNIKRAELEEYVDFNIIKSESTGGRPAIDYHLKLKSAMLVLIISQKTHESIKLYKELAALIGVDVLQIQRTRKELLFEINLNKLLEGITYIEKQYPVLDYRVDFYLPQLNIVIEYDEYNHKYSQDADKKRQSEIQDELGCGFIRVNEGDELKAINKINRFVLFGMLIDGYKNNKNNDIQEGILEYVGSDLSDIT